ncbi:zinc-ribbon domain-containing protein [Patescibacteria group bacterium]|nr:zinc-ribbon domain-containing protein [Patescibacteria group bacterium]MBU1931322.1 zinc-ribbon domain-containing protein [Patescibacteria group bacterium]
MEKTATCSQCGQQFLLIAMELKFYKRMGYPEPVNCPKCRHKKRQEQRGWRDFHKRVCDQCGRRIITIYSPQSGDIVYCEKCFQDYCNHVDPLRGLKPPETKIKA